MACIVLPILHSCPPPASAGTVNRSLPLVVNINCEGNRCPSSLSVLGANDPLHSTAQTPANRWLPAPGHLHSHCPAVLAQTTALAPLKVTDSPLSFSSRSQRSASPPTCPGIPPFSLAAILPRSHWLTSSIPPFLLVFWSFFLSLHRSFVAVPASMRVKAGFSLEIWLPIG